MTEYLTGTMVLDLSSVGPAARASRLLADFGAEVIKVGAVPSAGAVQIDPPAYAYSGQRFLRRALFDLKDGAGRAAFLKLAARADVILESFRPGVAARLGIGPDDVRKLNPAIVYCSTSGFGQDGPRSGWAGHDLDYLAIAGFLHMTGRQADGGPPIPGATIADAAGGGMHAALSILAALLNRARTGEGAVLDVSVAEGVLALMSLVIDEYLATERVPEPGHDLLTGRYACYDRYRCADGGWIAVAAIEHRFWQNVCRATGCDRWIDHQTDEQMQDQIRADLATAFGSQPRDHWVAKLGEGDGCVAPVLSISEVTEDEHFEARGCFTQVVHPSAGRFRQVAPVLAGQRRPSGDPLPLPDWSRTHTAELLSEAGMDPTEIEGLLRLGVVA